MKQHSVLPKLCLAWAAIVVLLGGCGDFDTASPPETSEALQGAVTARLALTLPSGADAQAWDTLEYFAQAAARLSGGELEITLSAAADPLTSLTHEECSLAFVSTARMADEQEDMAMTQAPFFWRNYNHFTEALNRPDNLELAGQLFAQELSARPLGVYYRGTVNLVSTRRVYDERGISNLNMALEEGASTSYNCFWAMGAPLRLYSDEQELTQLLWDKEIRATEADAELAARLSKTFSRLYCVPTGHYIQGDWLLLSQRAAQALTGRQLAVLAEAMAESLEYNDRLRLEAEAKVWGDSGDQLLLAVGEFPRLRAMGERYLAQEMIPNQEWSGRLLRAYRMGLDLITDVPEAEEAPEDEPEENEE